MSDWGLSTIPSPLPALFANSGARPAAVDPNAAPAGVPVAAPPVAGAGLPDSARDVMKNLMVYLAQKVKGGDVASIDATMADLNKVAATGPNPLTLQANNLLDQAKAANGIADFMKNNPQAPPELQTAQNVSPLSLPEVPQYVQPSANPVASIGAGIAGLFAPRAAGAFGAAALQGAITATDKLNAAKRAEYQQQFQQSLVQHEDDVRRADAQARIDAQNSALKNAYSAEQHTDNLKEAVERSNASQLSGQAGNLKAFIAGSGPADAAKAQIQQLEEKRKQASAEQIQAYKTLADVSSSVSQTDIEDQRLQQSAAQFQQSQKAASDKAAQEMQRYDADRTSREKISGDRAALDERLGNQTNATAMYRITMDHNDRVARLQQEDRLSGAPLKDPKTYETIAAQQTMDAAAQRLKDAQQQLNAPSINNPNFNPRKADDPAMTNKRQKEVDYAQRQLDIARQQFLDAGQAARTTQENSYTDPTTGRVKRRASGGVGLPGMPPPGSNVIEYNADGTRR